MLPEIILIDFKKRTVRSNPPILSTSHVFEDDWKEKIPPSQQVFSRFFIDDDQRAYLSSPVIAKYGGCHIPIPIEDFRRLVKYRETPTLDKISLWG